jgi:amidase
MKHDDLARLDATAQAELVARGQASPLELVEAAIERIERLNPKLNAVIYERFEEARTKAAGPRSILPAPFRGVPFLMKDLIQTVEGQPFSWGWKPLKEAGATAPLTSYVAQKFIHSGLITLGQTTVPEWGVNISTETAAWGMTRNPWNPERSAGGSSGGAGAAVASGMVAIAHGNDAGGSIRIPASMCGLVGMKPSRGRTSLGPLFADFWNMAIEEGVLARSVRDVARALDVIRGPMPGDPYQAPPPDRPYGEEVEIEPGPLHIGFVDRGPSHHPPLHPEAVNAVRGTAKLLGELGHRVEDSFPAALDDPEFDPWFAKLIGVHEAAMVPSVENLLGRTLGAADFEPWTWALIEYGRTLGAVDYVSFGDWRNRYTRALASWWTSGYDILLTPVVAGPAFPLGYTKLRPGEDWKANLSRIMHCIPFTPPWNLSGQPALALPLHMTGSGLPIGTQFVAAYGREDLLFRLGAQIERSAPWRDRQPPVCG